MKIVAKDLLTKMKEEGLAGKKKFEEELKRMMKEAELAVNKKTEEELAKKIILPVNELYIFIIKTLKLEKIKKQGLI